MSLSSSTATAILSKVEAAETSSTANDNHHHHHNEQQLHHQESCNLNNTATTATTTTATTTSETIDNSDNIQATNPAGGGGGGNVDSPQQTPSSLSSDNNNNNNNSNSNNNDNDGTTITPIVVAASSSSSSTGVVEDDKNTVIHHHHHVDNNNIIGNLESSSEQQLEQQSLESSSQHQLDDEHQQDDNKEEALSSPQQQQPQVLKQDKEEEELSNPFHLVRDCNELPINERYHSDLRPFLERLEEQPNRFKSIDQETVNMILGDWMVLTMDHLSSKYKQVAPPYLYCKQVNNQYMPQNNQSIYENELEKHLLMIGHPNRVQSNRDFINNNSSSTTTAAATTTINNNNRITITSIDGTNIPLLDQQHLTSTGSNAINNLNILSSNELTYSEDYIEEDDEYDEELERNTLVSSNVSNNRKQTQHLNNQSSDLTNEHFNTQLSKRNVSQQGSFNSNLSASYNKFSLSDQAINLNNSEYNSSIGMPRYTSQPINFTQPRDFAAERISKQELITTNNYSHHYNDDNHQHHDQHQQHQHHHREGHYGKRVGTSSRGQKHHDGFPPIVSANTNSANVYNEELDEECSSEDLSSIMVLGDNINNINDHDAFSPNTRSMYEDMGKSTIIQLQGSYRHQTLLDKTVRSSFSSNPYNSPANSRNQIVTSSNSKRMTAEITLHNSYSALPSSSTATNYHERSTIASFEDLHGHTRRGSVFGRIDSDDEDEDNPLNTASTNTGGGGGEFSSPRYHGGTIHLDEDSLDQSHTAQSLSNSKGSRVRSIGHHSSESSKTKQVNRASFFDFIRKKPKKEFDTNSFDESLITNQTSSAYNNVSSLSANHLNSSGGSGSGGNVHFNHDIEKSKMDIISGESVSQLHEQLYGKRKRNESVFTKLKAKGIRPKDLKRIEGFKFKENLITQYELENPYRVISYYNSEYIWNGGQEIERCNRTRKVQPLYNNIDKMMYLIFEYEDFVLSKFGLPEPLFCKVSLYDVKSEVKLTEDFCFFIEPKHSLKSTSDSFSMNKLANSTQRHIKNINKRQNFEKASALFVFEKPEHTEVYMSFTVEKVFCGGLIEDAWKAYKSNNEKLMKKYLSQMNDFWRASMLRQPFIVMGQKIFYEGRNESDNATIEILEGQVKINKAYRIPSHSNSSFDILTFLKWLSNSNQNLPIQGNTGNDFTTTFNMDDDKNNIPIRFLFQTNTATRDKLASYLHAFSTRKSKASSQQSHTSMRFKSNDFSMFKTDQDDHVIETVMKRLDKSKGSFSVLDTFYKLFPVVESLHTSRDYYQFDFNLRNTLYIYLDTSELSSLSKTGNIYIKVSYKKNDMITSTKESRMADPFNDSNRFNYFYSSITHKKISPQFYDEIRLEIPSSANIIDKSHVLFEFFDLDISKGLDGKTPQNSDIDISLDGITNTQLIGFAYLRDVSNHCIVKDGYHTLTIFKSPKLVDNYLSLQTDIPMSHSSYLNIKTKALTSFYTQDPFAASFLDACDRFYNTFESTTCQKPKSEDNNTNLTNNNNREEVLLDVMAKLDNLRDANFAEILNHTPKVINGLLTLISTLVIMKNNNQYGTRTRVIVPEIISRAMSCLLFFLCGVETVSSSFGRNNYYLSTFISYFSRQYPDMEEPLYKMLMDEMLNFIQNWQESRNKDRKKPIVELGVFSPKISDLNFKSQYGIAKNIDTQRQISTFLFTSMELRPNGKQAEVQVKEFKDFINRERKKVSGKQKLVDEFNTQKIISEANPRKVSEISFTGVDVIKFGWFFFDLITKNIHIVRDEEFKKVSSQIFNADVFIGKLKQLIHTISPLLLECYEKRFKDSSIYAAATNFNLDFSLFLRDLVPILDFKYIREIMIEYLGIFEDRLSNDKTRDVAIFYILQFLELFIEHDDIFYIIQKPDNQFIVKKLIDCIIYGFTQKTDELKGLSLRILKNHLTKLDFDSRLQSQSDRNFIGNLYFDFVKKVIENKDSISDCITFKDELGDLFACFYHILKNSSDEKINEYFSSLQAEQILSLVDILQVTVLLMNIHNQNQVQICFHEVYMELFNKIVVNLYLKPKSEMYSEKTNEILSKYKDLLINHMLSGEENSPQMKQLTNQLTTSIYEIDSQSFIFYEVFDKSLHFLLSVVLLSPYLDSDHKRILFESFLQPFIETFKSFLFINEHIQSSDLNEEMMTKSQQPFNNLPSQLTSKIGISLTSSFDKTSSHLSQLLSDRNPKWKSILASVLSYCYFPTLSETFSNVRDVLYNLIEIYQHEQVDSIEDLMQKQQSHREYLLELGGTLHANRDTPHLSVKELEKMNFSKLESLVEKLFTNPNVHTNSSTSLLTLTSASSPLINTTTTTNNNNYSGAAGTGGAGGGNNVNHVSSPTLNNNTHSSNSNLQSNISNNSGNNMEMKLTYAEIFFSSYLFFTTPHQLLLMIRQILFKFAQNPEIEHKSELVLNITLSIKLWTEKHFTDMTQPFICNLIQFIDNDLTLVIKQVAIECFYLLEHVKSSLINCLLGIKENNNEEMKKKPNPIIPSGFSKLKLNLMTSFVPSFDLIAWSATEIARQLTLIDFEFFKQIDNKEICASTHLESYNFVQMKLPHLSSLLERKKDCEWWVITSILRERELNKRIEIINKFNQICEELFNMNNFFGLFAVYCGLSNHAILRLNKSWSKESKKIYRYLHENYFSDKIPQTRDNLIHRLNTVKLPIIPLVNSYLDEMKECNIEPTFRQSNGALFINFGKCIKIVEILQHFKSYQEVGYPFEHIPYLIKILCVDIPSDLIQNQAEALELSNHLESE